MNTLYEEARIAYEAAVDAEAKRLIEAGIASPWNAKVIAGENVRTKRRASHFFPYVEKRA